MIDKLSYNQASADAIKQLQLAEYLKEISEVPKDWKDRAVQISSSTDQDSESQQRPFILQTFINYGTEYHVQRLLRKWNYDEVIDYTWSNGGTMLIEATMRGRKEIVSLLCEYGASLDIATTTGWTALHTAAYGNHVEIVEILLNRNANVELWTKEERHTALDFANMRGNKSVARLLEAKMGSVGALSRRVSGVTSIREGVSVEPNSPQVGSRLTLFRSRKTI